MGNKKPPSVTARTEIQIIDFIDAAIRAPKKSTWVHLICRVGLSYRDLLSPYNPSHFPASRERFAAGPCRAVQGGRDSKNNLPYCLVSTRRSKMTTLSLSSLIKTTSELSRSTLNAISSFFKICGKDLSDFMNPIAASCN